jgi:2-C-methyl-D-erythritol 2,4-cyclodiphosphate synthase
MPAALKPKLRIGLGTDIHALASGRKLILGGIEIPFSKGLSGHSDADALLHAITDAILGAMGKGDIGEFFSDEDPQYKDASSKDLLTQVLKMMRKEKFEIQNVDAVIHAEEPKLKPYKSAIKKSVSRILQVNADQVNIKAKTAEGFDAVGQKKAISAQSVVLLEKSS